MPLAPPTLDLAKRRVFYAISRLLHGLAHGTTWDCSQAVSRAMPDQLRGER